MNEQADTSGLATSERNAFRHLNLSLVRFAGTSICENRLSGLRLLHLLPLVQRRSIRRGTISAVGQRGYGDCFLDRTEYAMGDDWKKEGERALRHTQRLVLIATREAVTESQPVAREVEIFTARSRHVIPIVFGDELADVEREDNPVLRRIPASQLYIDEKTRSVLAHGPSETAVDQLIRN